MDISFQEIFNYLDNDVYNKVIQIVIDLKILIKNNRDKKYTTYNVKKSYKYLINERLKFVETYDPHHYFKYQNNYEIAFIYPDEVEYIDGNQLSDKWFPVIIEN